MLQDLLALVFQYTGPEEVLKLYKSKVQRDKILKNVTFPQEKNICESGHIKTLKYLIKYKSLQPTSLMIIWCMPNGHLKLIKYLCTLILPNSNVIKHAIEHQRLKILKYLSAKVLISKLDLDFAAGCKNLDLFKYCASFVTPSERTMNKALKFRNTKVVQYLSEIPLLPTPEFIENVIIKKETSILDLCLTLKITKLQYTHNPAHLAIEGNNLPILQKLCDAGFKVSDSHLISTITNSQYNIFKYLITQMTISKDAIHFAISQNNLPAVKDLCALGFSSEIREVQIGIAKDSGYTKILDFLSSQNDTLEKMIREYPYCH